MPKLKSFLVGRRGQIMFQMIACNLAVLAIAGIYLAWRDRVAHTAHRRSLLRRRVAYMLWAAAQRA